MNLRIRKRITDFPISRQLRILAGRVLAHFYPEKASRIDKAPHSENWGPIARLIRNGLYHRALAGSDFETLGRYLSDYWSVDAEANFHETYADRFHDQFLLRDVALLAEVERLVTRDHRYTSLCEIGCGNGMVLEHYNRHVSGLESFVGLDLSLRQINENQKAFDAPMEFHHCDASEWIPHHGKAGTIYLTNGGVLECLTPRRVESLIQSAINRGRPTMFVIAENVATNHDLEADRSSHVYGPEYSFSHNYIYLFQAPGFRIRHFKERMILGERWIHLVAEHPGEPIP